jgi:hypothetical protein
MLAPRCKRAGRLISQTARNLFPSRPRDRSRRYPRRISFHHRPSGHCSAATSRGSCLPYLLRLSSRTTDQAQNCRLTATRWAADRHYTRSTRVSRPNYRIGLRSRFAARVAGRRLRRPPRRSDAPSSRRPAGFRWCASACCRPNSGWPSRDRPSHPGRRNYRDRLSHSDRTSCAQPNRDRPSHPGQRNYRDRPSRVQLSRAPRSSVRLTGLRSRVRRMRPARWSNRPAEPRRTARREPVWPAADGLAAAGWWSG